MQLLPSTNQTPIQPATWRVLAQRTFQSTGIAVLLAASAVAQDTFLLKTGRQQALRDLNYITPKADATIQAQGDAVVSGDFDGDGLIDTASRRAGRGTWLITNGETISDGLPFFNPANAAIAVGDFNGDQIDEIAWRLDGCPFWIVNTTVDAIGGYIIFDGVSGIPFSQMSIKVGDYDCDGADELAVRGTGWPGWGINDIDIPLQVIVDGRADFSTETSALAVVDIADCGTLAWRNSGDEGWMLNGLAEPSSFLMDGLGSSFDISDTDYKSGDFDGNGSTEIAWRKTGTSSWIVNNEGGTSVIDDGNTGFNTTPTRCVVGDFDGDSVDDLAYRHEGSVFWQISSVVNQNWTIFGDLDGYEADLPHHVGDFNGDGKDDIAWLPEDSKDEWSVDTEDEHLDFNDNNWHESTETIRISYEFIYTDVDGDGQLNDYVLMVKNPDGSAFLLHKPLQMAYFCAAQGMTITTAFFEEALSPAQQQAFFEDCQTPELASSFTTTVSLSGPSSTTFNQSNFNGNMESITEMEGIAEYTAVEDIQRTGDVEGTCELIDFGASGIFDDNGAGGEVSFTTSALGVNYGPATGMVFAGQAEAKLYVGQGGFALGASATLVGATAQFGSPEGSNVSVGVGAGIGAAAGGSWGDNDQYGAGIDVGFISFGVYVTGDDAKEVYGDGKQWCVNAINDTADWGASAYDDTIDFLSTNPIEGTYTAIESQFSDLFMEIDASDDEDIQALIQSFDDGISFFTDLENADDPGEFFDTFASGTGTSGFVDDVESTVNDFTDDPIGFIGGLW